MPKTYSTIFTPKPLVSEDLGDKILPADSPAGKLPDLLVTIKGCETPCSANKGTPTLKFETNAKFHVLVSLSSQVCEIAVSFRISIRSHLAGYLRKGDGNETEKFQIPAENVKVEYFSSRISTFRDFNEPIGQPF